MAKASNKTAQNVTPTGRVRTSRIPIDKIAHALTFTAAQVAAGTGASVKAVAGKLKITERDVRLGIDAMRRQSGYDSVRRVGPGTFAIVGAKAKAAPRKAKAPATVDTGAADIAVADAADATA